MATRLQLKDKIDSEKSIKIAVFRKDIRKTTPHKHNNYFEIIYLSRGKGYHAIDTINFPVTPPVVFIIRKEQVHHWELEDEPEGYVLILKKSFVDTSLDKELKNLLTQVSGYSSISLRENKTIGQLFTLLAEETDPEGRDGNMPVTEGLLKALLAKILQVAKPIAVNKKKTSDLFLNFRELLSQEKMLINNVSHYAELLNTSPQNLNAACRKAINQPAAEVLAEFIISEAKRLLLYTDMSIAQISLALDFKDNSHFVKYFKRHTGSTPQSFRSLY